MTNYFYNPKVITVDNLAYVSLFLEHKGEITKIGYAVGKDYKRALKKAHLVIEFLNDFYKNVLWIIPCLTKEKIRSIARNILTNPRI